MDQEIELIDIENETTRLRSDSNTMPTNNSDLCLFSSQNQNKLLKHENKVELKNKLISVFFHIFLMSVFEIFFYFFFIVEIEKELFLDKLMTYNEQIKDNYYANVSPEHQLAITQLINNAFDETMMTEIKQNYDADMQKQKQLFNVLLNKAIILSSIVGTIFFLTVIYGRKDIKVNWVLFENILLFFFLGLYEYIFFNMIILKYTPITDGEIQYLFVCNVASIFEVEC